MGSVTMAKRVRRKMLGDSGCFGGLSTSEPYGVGRNGNIGTAMFHRTGKEKGSGFRPTPVDAQSLQQSGTQRYFAVSSAFPLLNADHHAPAIDIIRPQTTQFGPAHAGGIQGHEQSAVIEIAGRLNQAGYLFGTEDSGESSRLFGKRNVLGQEAPAQCFYEEETQRRGVLGHGSWRELFHLKQMSLVLTNLFRAKLVGCAMKMLREIMDDPNVGFCCTMRVITTLEFLQHHFAKMGHRDLLVTHNLFQRKQLSFSGSRARRSVRRASGFVQIPIALIDVGCRVGAPSSVP